MTPWRWRVEIPKCKRPECPRSDVVVLNQNDETIAFYCRTCRLTFAYSRSHRRAHAQRQEQKKRREWFENLRRKKTIFT